MTIYSPHKTRGFLLRLFSAALAIGVLLAGCSGQRARAPKLFDMGELAETGSLVYSVLEAEWYSQLGQTRLPQHRFLVLRVSVTNSGVSDVLVPPMQMIAGGNAYGESADGNGVREWLGTLRKLKPAETVHGRVLFDLPRNDYQLRVTDDVPEQQQAAVALIEVPLRFGSEPSSISIPAPAQ